MKRILLFVLVAAGLLASGAPPKPKLLVAIIIDQFRYDYLTRFRSEYTAGFDRLLTRGAVFTNANYIQFPTVTAAGHSTFLTGATPSVSGIVANEWFDREEAAHVTSVSDRGTKLLGGDPQEGASPHRLLVSTVGDELKMAHGGKSRVIGISLKDRAAILPAGHAADAAYWFDLKTGNFVSSTYYFAALPGWVLDFNQLRPADRFRGAAWLGHKLPQDFRAYYGDNNASPFEASPFGNEMVEQFAERALVAEQLGKHDATDVLAVSFSSNDKVGHDYGPFSPEEHDLTVRTDKILDRLFQAIDRQVGLDNVLIVLSGDHGVAPSAAEAAANHMPGGRMPANTVRVAIQNALAARYGNGEWVLGSWDLSIFLNLELIAARKLDPAELRRVAAGAAYGVGHIARVYTRDQLLSGAVPGDEMSRRVMNGFNVRRSGDILFLPEPYWVVTDVLASHGTTYSYDAHVPVIFLGPGIVAGHYDNSIIVNDIAPTLATILEIETPSGSIGRVLTEMFAR
ncbi:MAG TPA: alkaline phosphatase family protein [Bryobacteraceae bacterium]|nr:alkaline phosphatase family protein [Bryobacteraceae bacterium]